MDGGLYFQVWYLDVTYVCGYAYITNSLLLRVFYVDEESSSSQASKQTNIQTDRIPRIDTTKWVDISVVKESRRISISCVQAL